MTHVCVCVCTYLVEVETRRPYVVVQSSEVAVCLFDKGHHPQLVGLLAFLWRQNMVGREAGGYGVLRAEGQEGAGARRDAVILKVHTCLGNDHLHRRGRTEHASRRYVNIESPSAAHLNG